MTKFVTGVASFVLAVLMTFSVPSAAQAQETVRVDCSGLSRSACEAAVANIRRAPYTGPVRPATEPMACARVVSYGPVAVEWVDTGSVSTNRWREGRLITTTGIAHAETFPLNAGWTVTESCIPRRLLNGVSELTLCTGLYEDGFHWRVHGQTLRNMQRTGHPGTFLPFLHERDTGSLSPQSLHLAYIARYGVRLRIGS